MNKTIDVIVGARPNFMKVAALFAVADQFPSLELRLIHTGQHYDAAMSDVFFSELGLPEPACHFDVGSKSHAVQTAEIMIAYDDWLNENPTDICLVVGDVNSTVACALVAAKRQIPVAHVEAGLRSFDRTMPEELNRIITDSLSNLMFANEPSAVDNLNQEGAISNNVYLVGNVMIDTLLRQLPVAKKRKKYLEFGFESGEYVFVTLHRPSNVDVQSTLEEIVSQLIWVSEREKVLFSVHPRTKKQLINTRLYSNLKALSNFQIVPPLPYIDALSLTSNAKVVITDSGGIQEETSILNVPCLTLRNNTERPITVDKGTNTLIGSNWTLFRELFGQIQKGSYPKKQSVIPFWDGNTGYRILEILEQS